MTHILQYKIWINVIILQQPFKYCLVILANFTPKKSPQKIDLFRPFNICNPIKSWHEIVYQILVVISLPIFAKICACQIGNHFPQGLWEKKCFLSNIFGPIPKGVCIRWALGTEPWTSWTLYCTWRADCCALAASWWREDVVQMLWAMSGSTSAYKIQFWKIHICWWFRNPARKPSGMYNTPCKSWDKVQKVPTSGELRISSINQYPFSMSKSSLLKM